MARLPGINYTAGVPSLGRTDPMAPVRVANVQARALATIGNVTAKVANDIYEANALTEETSAWNQYQEEMLNQERDMSASPYTQDEETGELFPNYHSLPKAYEETESGVRENILGGVSNALAKKNLQVRMEERRIKGQAGANNTALAWMREEGQIVAQNDIKSKIEGRDIPGARETLRNFSNIMSTEQRVGAKAYIDGKEVYQKYEDILDPNAVSIDDFQGIREQLNDHDNPEIAKMSNEDLADLKTLINRTVEDAMGASVHVGFQLGGLPAIEQAIQSVNQSSLEAFGFENEMHKQQTLSFMRGVQANYGKAYTRAKTENEEDLRFREILDNGLLDFNETADKFKNDMQIYNERIFRPVTENMEPLSEEWNNAVGALSQTYGAPPPEAMGYISANLHNPNPARAVAAAASLKRIINANPSHAGLTINEKDLDFAYWLNSMSEYGLPTEQAIDEYRNGIKGLDSSARAASAEIVAAMKPEDFVTLLDASIDAHDGLDPWFGTQATATPRFAFEVQKLFQHYMPLVGNVPEAAMSRAFAVSMSQWGSTDTDGVQLLKHAPNTKIKGKNVREWTDEDFEVNILDKYDLDADEVGRQYVGGENGVHTWAVLTSTGDLLIDDDGMPIFHTPIFGESPAQKRIDKAYDRDRLQDEINAGLPPSIYTGEKYKGFKGTWRERGDDLYKATEETIEGLSLVQRTSIDMIFGDVYQYGTQAMIDKHETETAESLAIEKRAHAITRQESRNNFMNRYPGRELPPYMQEPGIGGDPGSYTNGE